MPLGQITLLVTFSIESLHFKVVDIDATHHAIQTRKIYGNSSLHLPSLQMLGPKDPLPSSSAQGLKVASYDSAKQSNISRYGVQLA
jgi:hypothetical protein